MKNIMNSESLASLSSIDFPPDFTALKAYESGTLRAEKSAREFNSQYVVSRGSSYKRVGPPIACCGDRKRIPHLEKGRLFVTATKDHSEAGRIANGHRANPIMSMNSRDSPSSPNLSRISSIRTDQLAPERVLEKGFNTAAHNGSLNAKTSWRQFEPVNSSLDPYLAVKSSFKPKLPHKEMSQSPEHSDYAERRKLLFLSGSLRSLDS
jgi:hypothetical protein